MLPRTRPAMHSHLRREAGHGNERIDHDVPPVLTERVPDAEDVRQETSSVASSPSETSGGSQPLHRTSLRQSPARQRLQQSPLKSHREAPATNATAVTARCGSSDLRSIDRFSLDKSKSQHRRRAEKEREQNERMMIRILRRQDSLTTTASTEFSYSTKSTVSHALPSPPAGPLHAIEGGFTPSIGDFVNDKHVRPTVTQTQLLETDDPDPTADVPLSSPSSRRTKRTSCQPPTKTSSAHSRRPRTVMRDDLVRAVIHDFYEDLNSNITSKSIEIWRSLYEKYHSPNYMMVRPSGNPLDTNGFIQMFISKDVRLFEFRLQNIDSVQLIADDTVAIVTYTVDQRFSYQGTLHQDRVRNTCVLEECNGDIKMCHEQRSTGHPIPEE